ncbi:hypothetical protein CCACVL1_15718 [Corchorus capsularis]|uniref:Uncharacterized protein n=1 Tax=Corchorus capsularis TaxID=210143 RepID=A0A1R3I1B3_COCAP|nr:hypothetical protein CCACVL1_15718 [Corchorus capsularis]
MAIGKATTLTKNKEDATLRFIQGAKNGKG